MTCRKGKRGLSRGCVGVTDLLAVAKWEGGVLKGKGILGIGDGGVLADWGPQKNNASWDETPMIWMFGEE